MKISDQVLERVEGQKERIGQLLLKHTSLTEGQLEEALEIQHESGMLLGEILLKKNYIHPHDLIKVLCHQVDIPYVNELKLDEIDPNLTLNISINYAKNHEILPILETSETHRIFTTKSSRCH